MPGNLILAAFFAVIAALFASVGQAGGVGYVAVMGLYGFGAADTKMVALTLTLIVAIIGLLHFHWHGLLKSRDWYPFALLGAPLSLAGGIITLPGATYRWVMAALLVLAALQMIRTVWAAENDQAATAMPFLRSLLLGGAAGLIAGITGVGAGVFLAAALMSLRWASTRRVVTVAQASNLFTSLPALVGAWIAHPALPQQLPGWAFAVGLGGAVGSWLGARHLPVAALRMILAAILLLSGLKLALS